MRIVSLVLLHVLVCISEWVSVPACVLLLVCMYIVLYGNLSHKDVHVLLTQHTEVEVISMYVTSCVLLFVIKIELVLASEFNFPFCFYLS